MTDAIPNSRCALAAFAVAATLIVAARPAVAEENWSPKASEQLIKLPGDFLKKAVNSNYARSGLAAALTKLDEQIVLKKKTLTDLHGAVERADGALRVELQHQLLEEKRAFVELSKKHQELRTRRARTKVRLYENLLARTRQKARAGSPQRKQLIERQAAARDRFEASMQAVDTGLLRSSFASESRYAGEYAKNFAAIESLAQAIRAHPMNQTPQIDGVPVTREEYLRQLIAENQADLSVIEQERTLLGYMAKLVSLDALALSENVAGNEVTVTADADLPKQESLSGAIDLFAAR